MEPSKKMDLDLKKGALTQTVLKKYGKAGFIKARKKGERPKIKLQVLRELEESPNKLTRKRARFALSARGWKHKPNKNGGK